MTDDERLRLGQLLLGARLRQQRDTSAMTLEEVAASTGLSPTYISNIEHAHKLISLAALLSLADTYDTTVAELLTDVYPFGTSHRPPRPAPISDGRVPKPT
jgi:transcriptional regulator with XRE-family HTH domain